MNENALDIWVEKWAPTKFEDLILPNAINKFFSEVINQGAFNQSLILNGTKGCGKTQTIKTISSITGQDVLFLNGSSEGRYLDTIRNQVIEFGSTVSLFHDKKKIVFFDEFEGTTNDVMLCLRGVMEQLHNNVCFVFTCNNLSRIIDPIKSRCVVLNYTPIPKKEKPKLMANIYKRLVYILEQEGIKYIPEVLVELVKNNFPDTRQLINILQSYSMSGEINTGILVNQSESSIDALIKSLKEKNYKDVTKWVFSNIDNDSSVVLRRLYDRINTCLVPSTLPSAVLIIAKYDYQAAFASDKEINLLAALTEIMCECEFAE